MECDSGCTSARTCNGTSVHRDVRPSRAGPDREPACRRVLPSDVYTNICSCYAHCPAASSTRTSGAPMPSGGATSGDRPEPPEAAAGDGQTERRTGAARARAGRPGPNGEACRSPSAGTSGRGARSPSSGAAAATRSSASSRRGSSRRAGGGTGATSAARTGACAPVAASSTCATTASASVGARAGGRLTQAAGAGGTGLPSVVSIQPPPTIRRSEVKALAGLGALTQPLPWATSRRRTPPVPLACRDEPCTRRRRGDAARPARHPKVRTAESSS